MFAVCLIVGGFSLCYNKDVTDDGTVSLNPFLGHKWRSQQLRDSTLVSSTLGTVTEGDARTLIAERTQEVW